MSGPELEPGERQAWMLDTSGQSTFQSGCMGCVQVAAGAGMVPCTPALTPPALPAYVSISLDGRLIGYIQSGVLPSHLKRCCAIYVRRRLSCILHSLTLHSCTPTGACVGLTLACLSADELHKRHSTAGILKSHLSVTGYAGRLADYFRRLKAARLAADSGLPLPPGSPPLKVSSCS